MQPEQTFRLALQVWVRQTVVENDLNLFKELPTHLRAQVAWRSNKSIMDKLDTFQVRFQKVWHAHWDSANLALCIGTISYQHAAVWH